MEMSEESFEVPKRDGRLLAEHSWATGQRAPVASGRLYASLEDLSGTLGIANSLLTFSDTKTSVVSAQALRPSRDDLEQEVSTALNNLSPQARSLLALPEMERLKSVPNSAMAGTHIFSHVDVSRWEHVVHAASLVSFLRQARIERPDTMQLTDRELLVLEISLLFHDIGHVLGSHAMDKVFATLRPDVCIGKQYYDGDYHELHGAQIVGRGESSADIRAVLGEDVFGDVMAVLTHKDKRPIEEKVKTYGPYSPTFSYERTKAFARLEDRFDRASYVTLDLLCGGYDQDKVQAKKDLAREYVGSLTVKGDVVAVEGSVSEDPYAKLIKARDEHFNHIPDHPINSLLSMVLRDAVLARFQDFRDRAGSMDKPIYDWLRDELLAGNYELVLGREHYDMIVKPEMCVSELIAPVVTLDRKHLTQAGLRALDVNFPGAVKNIPEGYTTGWGAPASNPLIHEMSELEMAVRTELHQRGISVPVFFVMPARSPRTFLHDVSTNDGVILKQYTDGESPNQAGRAQPVVVFAKAFDENGKALNLSEVRHAVESVLKNKEWVENPDHEFQHSYDPKILVRLKDEGPFDPVIRCKVKGLRPTWIQRGGCGLLHTPHPS
jgi:hypothetical protein